MTHNPRTALVTGASPGIGRSIAEQFARDGVNPIISARSQAQALYEAIESRGMAA